MFALWDLIWLCCVRPDDRSTDYIAKTGRQVLTYGNELDDYYHKAAVRYTLSLDCLERGYINEAEQWARELLDFGRSADYAPGVSVGSVFLALCFALREDFAQARELTEAAISAAVSEIERAIGLAVKGMVLTLEGQFEEARDLLAYVRKVAHEETFQVLLTSVEIPYGAALVFSGDVERGLQTLRDAIVMFSTWRNSRMIAWAHLVLGQIYLHMAEEGAEGATEEARQQLEAAGRVGRKAGTEGHVAEAMLCLGLLAKACGQPNEARAHFEAAGEVAAPLGWPTLSGKIESALAAL